MNDHVMHPDELIAALDPIEQLLVVLDFDGTLSPIVDRPGDAQPVDGALDALRSACAHTTVAVISGRQIPELLERLPDVPLLFAGGHGAQVRDADGVETHLIDIASVTAALDTAEAAVSAAVDDGSGWLVERKPTSLAVHHRLVPEDEEAALLPRVQALLDAQRDELPGFTVLTGKAILELRPRDVDKGRALTWIADRFPVLRPVVFGDDVTDEDAFRVAVERGGTAVVVGEDDRPSLASARLADPAAVVAVLSGLVARSKVGSSHRIQDGPQVEQEAE